jgi:hypothetical protein
VTGAERFAAMLPPWLDAAKPVVGRLVAAVGERVDELQAAAHAVRRARFIQTAPEWALAVHAQRLRQPRVVGEELEVWRRRLLTAWELFQAGGTRQGLSRALERVFGEPPTIIEHVFDQVARYGPDTYYGAFSYGEHRWAEFTVEVPSATAASHGVALAVINRLRPATKALRALVVPTFASATSQPIYMTPTSTAERGDLTLYGPGTEYGEFDYGADWSPL